MSLDDIAKQSFGAKFLHGDEVFDLESSLLPRGGDSIKQEEVLGLEGVIELWTLMGDKLCLVELIGKHNLAIDLPIFAKWFTGVIKLPLSNDYYKEPISVGSFHKSGVFMNELNITIENGLLINTEHIENTLSSEECLERKARDKAIEHILSNLRDK